MGVSLLGRRVPSKVRTIYGNRSAEFYLGGSIVMDAVHLSNAHATATTLVEIQDKRRNQKASAFYYNVPPMGGRDIATSFFWPHGFTVKTGNSAKATIVFTDGGNE